MTLDLDQIERINNAGDRYGHITPGVVAELCAEVRRLRERREGPGSPAARFSYLLHELEALFPGVVNPVLSDPPETKLIDAVRQLRAELNGFTTACGEMNVEVVGLREENSALHELHTGLTQACLREQEWQKKKDQYLDEIEVDAERYRWLRNEANSRADLRRAPMALMTNDDCSNDGWQDVLQGEALDDAIDAAKGTKKP